MRSIFKYTLDLMGSRPQYIMTPGRPIFRHFGMQGGSPCVWLDVEPNSDDKYATEFVIVGTGYRIPEGYTYCGTTQHDQFVWHLYQEG